MKLKKVMLMAALAAAIGSVNMVTALARTRQRQSTVGKAAEIPGATMIPTET